jgi:hypothetical protein
MAISRRGAFVVAAWLVAAGLLAATPSVASAANGLTDTGTTTYTLDPVDGVIHVVADIRLVNTRPNSGGYYFYYDSTSLWVEAEATGIRITSSSGSVTVTKRTLDGHFRRLDLSFSSLFYGQTRTLHVTYTIPGGKPRSTTETRALKAYADFCVIPQGNDSGVVRVRMPAAYVTDVTGSSMTSTVSGTTRIYSSGTISDPAAWWACLEGVNDSGYSAAEVSTQDGEKVILDSWPEDTAWASGVRDALTADLPALVHLVGRPIAGPRSLVIKESATGNEYAGFYDDTTNTITVGEDYLQPNLVAHELAHAWFNDFVFSETWLSEGYAEWAARTVDPSQGACSQPATPTGANPDLADWRYINPKSTTAERDTVEFEYAASCYVITKVMNSADATGVSAAMEALLDGENPYAIDPSSTKSPRFLGWKQWLDAVDELALRPAGAPASLASDLLLDYGVTNDRSTLAARTAARTAYIQLSDKVSPWIVPNAIRTPLHGWDFAAAQSAVAAALPAWTITGRTDETLAGIDARNGPVSDAWAAASTEADLEAATALAQRQLDAATDVADAIAVADAPRDLVLEIGLIGETVPSLDPAITAVRTINTDESSRVANDVRDVLRQSRSTGELRIGAFVGTVLLLVVGLLAFAFRRRRRTRAAVADPGDTVASEASPEATGSVGPPGPSEPPPSPASDRPSGP